MMIKKIFWTMAAISLMQVLFGCSQPEEVVRHGKHYQQHRDYYSLSCVVNLVKQDADKAYLKKILGEPIDMGFDYRYLIDSTGENGCPIGAVFHFSDQKVVDDLWIGEICE